MQVELLSDEWGPNPEYDIEEAKKMRQLGQPYPIAKDVPLKAGTIVEGDDAHLLVKIGKAKPVDDSQPVNNGEQEDDETASDSDEG